MPMEPPPRLVNKFDKIWRDWLYFFWQFVFKHTGGSIPTPPATGTSWNAHGDIATGDGTADNPLEIANSSFYIGGDVGATPSAAAAFGRHFMWIPDKWALRIGDVISDPNLWSDANIAPQTIAMGADANCGGSGSSIAIGNAAQTLGVSNVAIGPEAEAGDTVGNLSLGFQAKSTGVGGIAIGYDVTAHPFFSFGLAMGQYLDIGGGFTQNAIIIGKGVNGTTGRFVNSVSNSVQMGVGINTAAGDPPTLTLRNKRHGVNEIDPLSTLDIGGSVGAKYTNLPATTEIAKTIIASDNEYTFRIDLSALSSGTTYTLTLPLLSTIDRRIFYIKVTDINSLGGTLNCVIKTNAADQIENVAGGLGTPYTASISSTIGVFLTPGDSLLLLGNSTDGIWWAQ